MLYFISDQWDLAFFQFGEMLVLIFSLFLGKILYILIHVLLPFGVFCTIQFTVQQQIWPYFNLFKLYFILHHFTIYYLNFIICSDILMYETFVQNLGLQGTGEQHIIHPRCAQSVSNTSSNSLFEQLNQPHIVDSGFLNVKGM